MSADDDITDELLADAEKPTGLSLELLGLDPRPEVLDEMAAVAPEDRQEFARQTRLLAALLWNSSGIIMDQLFRELGTLVHGWTAPGCFAAELAVRCLLDQAEIAEDIYELDLPDKWRADVEEVHLEDADSEALFSDRRHDLEDDVSELDFAHWFRPFTSGDAVPPYAYS